MKYAIILLFVFTRVAAQKLPDYVVYLVKGEVMIQKKGAQPVRLKPHQFVYEADNLTLKKGAEVTLSNRDGAIIVLSATKSYPVSSLSKSQVKTSDNLTKKYLHLLYHELLDPNHDYNKFRQSNIGGVWGGVSRGEHCGNLLLPVKELKTAEIVLPFKWRRTSNANLYTLKLFDGELKEIASIPVNDTPTTVNLLPYTSGKAGKYFWKIKGENGECEDETPIAFETIKKQEEDKLVSALQNDDSSLFTELATAHELESNKLIFAAKQHLNNLLRKYNDPILVKTLAWFLIKYHFSEEAKSLWTKSISK